MDGAGLDTIDETASSMKPKNLAEEILEASELMGLSVVSNRKETLQYNIKRLGLNTENEGIME